MLENGDVNIELTAAAGTDGEEITARLFSDGGYRVVNGHATIPLLRVKKREQRLCDAVLRTFSIFERSPNPCH